MKNFSRLQLTLAFVGLGSLAGYAVPSFAQQHMAKTNATKTAGTMKSATMEPAASGRMVYEWNPASYRSGIGNPWTNETLTRPDGRGAQRINITGESYSNYLQVPAGLLQSGHNYTAYLKYEIVNPPTASNAFYMFARSLKLGNAKDFWQKWSGDAGMKGVARLTFSLTGDRASDDWAFFVGGMGKGTIIVDSLQIVEGDGLNYVPATVTARPEPIALKSAPKAKLPQPGLPKTGLKLPTGATPFVLEPPAPQKGLQIQAKDFGLTPDGAAGRVSNEVAANNFLAVKKAIDACRTQKASVLSFEPGTYRFYTDEAIPFVELSDLTIDGHGAQFVFEKLHSGIEAVSVTRSQRLVIKNLKMDWDWDVAPLGSMAKVVSVRADGLGCDLTFPDLDEKGVEASKKAPWMQMIGVDADTLTRNGSGHASVSVTDLQNVDARTLRVTFKEPIALRLNVGSAYTIRHFYYGYDAFKVGYSNNVWFDNVIVYSMPGMGWFNTGDVYNWKFTNCKVVRPEGSRRPYTTSADGFHVSQSQGNLTLENCEFTGCGDDPINIHDNCFQGVERISDTTLKLVALPNHRFRLNQGDKIALFRSDYSPFNFVSTVKTMEYTGKDYFVTLTDVLPAAVPPMAIVQNRRFNTHNVRIANCNFHDCNGRQILLSAHNSTIENCLFKNSIGTAIQMHTEIVGTSWAEGSGVSNLVIRGNTFDSTSYEGRYENAVVYAGAKLALGITSYPLFHDVLIEKNRFINSPGPAVSLYSSKNVIVRDNSISAPHPRPVANSLSNSLYTAYASDITFSGNGWQGKPTIGKAGVLFDSQTTTDIVVQENSLLPSALGN